MGGFRMSCGKRWSLVLPRLEHPLGYYNPSTPDRRSMDGILLVLHRLQRRVRQWRAQQGP